MESVYSCVMALCANLEKTTNSSEIHNLGCLVGGDQVQNIDTWGASVSFKSSASKARHIANTVWPSYRVLHCTNFQSRLQRSQKFSQLEMVLCTLCGDFAWDRDCDARRGAVWVRVRRPPFFCAADTRTLVVDRIGASVCFAWS